MLYYLPLERLEERYTGQMYKEVITTLTNAQVDFRIVDGEPLRDRTEGHQFLHPASRAHFSLTQTARFIRELDNGTVKDGDKVFVADLWHPGVEAIAYTAELSGIRLQIYGVHYAGVFSPYDLTNVFGMWGDLQEVAWLSMFEKVFVGSQWHKDVILQEHQRSASFRELDLESKIVSTGLVWNPNDALSLLNESPWRSVDQFGNQKVVMWPHRLDDSRNPEMFFELVDAIAPLYPYVVWLITSSRQGQRYEPPHEKIQFMVVTKPQYYAMLRDASLMLSTARQETFGYTIHEATLFETPVLCPNVSSYPETILSDENLYFDFEDAVRKIKVAIDGELPVATLLQRRGFNHMMEEMNL